MMELTLQYTFFKCAHNQNCHVSVISTPSQDTEECLSIFSVNVFHMKECLSERGMVTC